MFIINNVCETLVLFPPECIPPYPARVIAAAAGQRSLASTRRAAFSVLFTMIWKYCVFFLLTLAPWTAAIEDDGNYYLKTFFVSYYTQLIGSLTYSNQHTIIIKQ